MNMRHRMYAELESKSENEAYARVIVAAFCARLNPTIPELEDVKMAVSEAVTNAVIHGYGNSGGIIKFSGVISEHKVTFTITDFGVGIEDVTRAMKPLYTGAPDMERSGMGFTIMEEFMDEITVKSVVGKGTEVIMSKTILGGKTVNG